MNAMGERFLYLRMPEFDSIGRREFANIAARSTDDEDNSEIRANLIVNFFEALDIPSVLRTLTDLEQSWLSELANLASLCRSTVEVDGYSKEIINIPYAEMPGRITRQLMRLLFALEVIGVSSRYKYELVRRVALDCMPPTRLKVLKHLAVHRQVPTQTLARDLNMPVSTLWRALQPLKVHNVVVAHRTSDEIETGPADNKKGAPAADWRLSDECQRLWHASKRIDELLPNIHFRKIQPACDISFPKRRSSETC